MGCRGSFLSLSQEEADACQQGHSRHCKRVADMFNSLVETRPEDQYLDVDKSWDAMHRCLGDGTLDAHGGDDPLVWCVYGGLLLIDGPPADCAVSVVSDEQVRAVSAGLVGITENWFRQRYFALAMPRKRSGFFSFLRSQPLPYDGPIDEVDFGYTWAYFEEVRAFYAKAAAQGRAIIFMAS